MNCQEITKKSKVIKAKNNQLKDFIEQKKFDEALEIKGWLTENLKEERKTAEFIKSNQNMYDWLGIETNISKLYHTGEIVDLNPETKEKAFKEGYTQPIVVLKDIEQEQIEAGLEKQKLFIKEDYKPEDADTWQNPRPYRGYVIYTKPQELAKDAHPEIGIKTVSELKNISQKIKKDPLLDVYSINEYLLHQIYYFLKHSTYMDSFEKNDDNGVLLLGEHCNSATVSSPVVCGYHSDTYDDVPIDLTWEGLWQNQYTPGNEGLIRFLMVRKEAK